MYYLMISGVVMVEEGPAEEDPAEEDSAEAARTKKGEKMAMEAGMPGLLEGRAGVAAMDIYITLFRALMGMETVGTP
jgi:hypothetical protein